MPRPFAILILSAATLVRADEIAPPKKADGLPSPDVSLKSLTVAPGLKVDLWASEPLLENPVAFAFDDAGRAYIAETNRRRTSTLDIRRYESWVPAVLSHRTVADRVAFIQKELAPEKKLSPGPAKPDLNQDGRFDWHDLTIESERVRIVEDSDGDGRADKSRVLAEGFHDIATGTAAGVLPLPNGDVLYTCIPDLWLIKPDGAKKSLSTGYGVHIAYSGHDMHGLRLGPDGRVYFSIADCGASVKGGDGKRIECPDSGAVFRCWPDGTGLELFAKGLRNPQHLAFNDVGDLFTADNNADGGDKARLLHVVEGGDYGWRIGWQFLPKLGAWNTEGMWHLDSGKLNASTLPPIAHIGHGPAGFSYYPGTGLPESFKGHFFMADFPGGVRHFALKPKGATYELADFAPDAPALQNNQAGEMKGKLLWNLYPSDVQFPPGGGVMVLDWVQGWEKTGRGRIFKITAPELEKDPLIAETKRLLGGEIAKLSTENRDDVSKLSALLGHADQRVRFAAQYHLAEARRGGDLLLQVSHEEKGLSRLHAIWGVAQAYHLALRHGADNPITHLEALAALLDDKDDEVRAQVAKVCGEAKLAKAKPALLRLLKDPSPRVRFFAAQALAKFGSPLAPNKDAAISEALLTSLRENSVPEPMLRHALAGAAASNVEPKSLAALNEERAEHISLIALLALRHQKSPEVAQFLGSSKSELVRLEAARAIYDEPISVALPHLAKTTHREGAHKPTQPDPVESFARRVVLANYLLGTAESGNRLIGLASGPWAGTPVSEGTRLLAAEAIPRWNAITDIDSLTGLYRPPPPGRIRQPLNEEGIAGLKAGLQTNSKGAERIRPLLADAIADLGLVNLAPDLLLQVQGRNSADSQMRTASLRALARLNVPQLDEALKTALADKDPTVAEAARRIQANRSPEAALAQATAVLKKGSIPEQQQAIETLGRLEQAAADEQLINLLSKLKGGKLPAALHLDTLEAAARRSDPKVLSMIKEWDKLRPKNDPLAAWRECLEGGNAKAGREIFAEKAEAACLRCHAVAKQGGDVGPDLAGLAGKHDRAYLLRAIVDPNSEIAPGYENVLLTLTDGNVLAGIAAGEDADTLTLKNVADGKTQPVKKSTIKDRQKLPSAMPPALGEVLGKRALRDLLEYLATLK